MASFTARLCATRSAPLPLRLTQLAALPLLLVVGACGSGGDGGGGGGTPPPEAEPEEPVDEFPLRTAVPLDPMSYQLGGLTACLQKEQGPVLPNLPGTSAVDGDLGEWQGITGAATDPAGDAAAERDLTYAAVARRGEDLVLAFGAVPAATAVYIEVGGLVVRSGVLQPEVRRVFKHQNGVLADFDGGAFRPVAVEQGLARFTAAGGEIWLSRRLLGDVVGFPLWWVRAFTRGSDAAGADLADSTTAAYFPSMLDSDDPKFQITTCHSWAGRRLPIDLVQVRDTRAPKAYAQASVPVVAERVHELTRLALDGVVDVLGEPPLPTGNLMALATLNEVAALTDSTGFGLDADTEARTYRGFWVDARSLVPTAVESFPQGAVVRDVMGRIIDMTLAQWSPAAPTGLGEAWREALLDHLTRRHLGKSYWLDFYRDGLAAALQAKPLAAGAPLSAGHSLGAGRLLSALVEPAPLIKAWRAAAAAGGGTDALRAQLLAQLGGSSKAALRKSLGKLWGGWLAGGNFDPLFAPSALDDRDFDGVPDHVERVFHTSTDHADTDRDGWTDLAEIIAGIDAEVAGDTPGSIMPDGEFADWQQLLPKRLGVDRGRSGSCPKAADVEFYAALVTRDQLIVGAVAHEYWENEAAARWEVELDLPGKGEQLLVTGVGGEREYQVKQATAPHKLLRRYQRAMPVARKTIEWSIDRRALGLETYLDVDGAIRLRIRTLFKKDGRDLLCDETSWFVPSISVP